MSYAVESMMSVRQKPWHYELSKDVTKIIQEAPNSYEALVAAGLDWRVESQPVYDHNGILIPGYKANTRDKDGKVLGIVSDRYRIVQNEDAFQFTDNLIGGDVRYETAGSLCDGKKVWMLAKLPNKTIAGDETETYVCFTNTHDGSGAVKAIVTPVRVVCANTLNFALRTAKRSWAMRHSGNIEGKLEEAREALELSEIYMEELNKQAERWANVTVDEDALQKVLTTLFPEKADATARQKENVQKQKDDFMICYFSPDIAKFRGSAWGVLNAASDYATHREPMRKTSEFEANRWGKIMDGDALMDKCAELFATAV